MSAPTYRLSRKPLAGKKQISILEQDWFIANIPNYGKETDLSDLMIARDNLREAVVNALAALEIIETAMEEE